MDSPVLSRDAARAYLVGQAGLRAIVHPPGAAGVRALLGARRCIQLDPLDRIGTNADLVALARVDGIRVGDVYRDLMPGHAFEHFAKERCLLPPSAFPYYREQAVETPWWRHSERMKKLADLEPNLLEAVLDEVRDRGPVTPGGLTHRGRLEPMDWSGWKGTARVTTLALEVLWTRCRVVVASREGKHKAYDIPGRALPEVAGETPTGGFSPWALVERVEAAGLLSRNSGPWWSTLSSVRTSDLPDQLVRDGVLEEVTLEGTRRRYLAPAGFRDRRFPDDDGRMRILGPLDPLLWDRLLVRDAFAFDYVWEVYKPAAKRVWGYYVCPLLHRGVLVGRFEAHREQGMLVVDQLWKEDPRTFDDQAFTEALARHQEALAPIPG